MLADALGLKAEQEAPRPIAGSTGRLAPVVAIKGAKLTNHDVRNIDQRVALIVGLVQRGASDPDIIAKAREIVSRKCKQGRNGKEDWCIQARDWRAEIVAVHNEVKDKLVRYTRDPDGVDFFAGAKRVMAMGGADCFQAGTLVLTDDYRTVPVETLTRGQRIWGLDRWSVVGDVSHKGILPITAIKLNNGSWLKVTEDHKVYVMDCRHVGDDGCCSAAKQCSAPLAERTMRRIAVSELREGMVMAMPSRIPFGSETPDPDRAYMEGLYISDGWASHDTAFCISGKDGFPKEAQKREVEAIAARLGMPTKWHERYITVRDREWTARMQTMGMHAWEKRALSLNLGEAAAAALLRGIMADSGANSKCNSRTFTSTSRELALQVRILHKMFGITCGASYIENHGGLGTHPIWRLSNRRPSEQMEKLLRVSEIARNVISAPCWDISTDDHYVYLPEADVTVSNCDEMIGLELALLRAIGFPVELVVVETVNAPIPGEYEHIFGVAAYEDAQGKPQAMWLDPTVREQPAGWRVPESMVVREKAYAVP